MYSTDDHFLIGSMHVTAGKPCQDHALSGRCGDVAYAIVSDGCSSGGLTDVGARLVSLSMAGAIREHVTRKLPLLAEDLAVTQEETMAVAARLLPVETFDLLATCVYACLEPSGGFAHVRGDGIVALKWIDGSVTLHRFDWANNMPFYPAYRVGNTESFVRAHGGDPSALVLSEEVWTSSKEGVFKLQRNVTHSLSSGMKGITVPITPIEALDYVAVFSDGVTQVEGVDWKEAAQQLLAFKSLSLEGAFAKRRMIRFVQDSRKAGKGPIDDIAYAIIRVTHDGKEK